MNKWMLRVQQQHCAHDRSMQSISWTRWLYSSSFQLSYSISSPKKVAFWLDSPNGSLGQINWTQKRDLLLIRLVQAPKMSNYLASSNSVGCRSNCVKLWAMNSKTAEAYQASVVASDGPLIHEWLLQCLLGLSRQITAIWLQWYFWVRTNQCEGQLDVRTNFLGIQVQWLQSKLSL